MPLSASLLGLGCQDPLGAIEANGATPAYVELVDHEGLEAAPRVVRFRIELTASQFQPEDLQLFHGELSSYFRSRIASREVAESLLERRIPMLVWQLFPGEIMAQPSQVLDVESTYTLAALGYGVLAQIEVAPSELPVLWRRWPPSTSAGGAEGGLYCADRPVELRVVGLSMAPDSARGELSPFEQLPDCALLTVDEPASVHVPDPSLPAAFIDPAPLIHVNAATPVPSSCASGCYSIGPGCLCPTDDRARLVGPDASVFWIVQAEARTLQQETHGASAFVIPGLVPETSQAISGVWFDIQGRLSPFRLSFRTTPAEAHLSINEVYADPNGPEPAQEWVELVNDGTTSVNLEGYVLEDAGGATVLPNLALTPGAFAVVVNASYQPDADFDLLPDPSARLVRVERLGKAGLSNAGELLRLRASNGEVASRFPSRPAPEPGVSVARRTPWALDDDPGSFALHGPPGASPGLPNQFLEGSD